MQYGQTRVSNANMMRFSEKVSRFSWALFTPMCVVLALSIVVLYSAGHGSWQPFAFPQILKIGLGFVVFFIASFQI